MTKGEIVEMEQNAQEDRINADRGEMILVERQMLIDLLEPLRLARVYVLMGTEWEDTLGSDFKPWKWQGYEKEFADETTAAYRRVMDALLEGAES